MDHTIGTKVTANLSPTTAARALITTTIAQRGPMKVADLQKAVKLRRASFLKALKFLVELGAVGVAGRGIKGCPFLYSLERNSIEETGENRLLRRKLLIV